MQPSPRTIFAGVISAALGIATFSLEQFGGAGQVFVFLLLPGLIGSMAISGNVHAFPLWVAAIINILFYFGLVWILGVVWTKFRRNS